MLQSPAVDADEVPDAEPLHLHGVHSAVELTVVEKIGSVSPMTWNKKTRLFQIGDYRRLAPTIVTVTALATLLPVAWAQDPQFDAENEVPVGTLSNGVDSLSKTASPTPSIETIDFLNDEVHRNVDSIMASESKIADLVKSTMREVRAYYSDGHDDLRTKLSKFNEAWRSMRIPIEALRYIGIDVSDIYKHTGLYFLQLQRPRPPGCEPRHIRAGYNEARVEFRFGPPVEGTPPDTVATQTDPDTSIDLIVQRLRHDSLGRVQQLSTDDISADEMANAVVDYHVLIVVDISESRTSRDYKWQEGASDSAVVAVRRTAKIEYHVVDLGAQRWISGLYPVSDQNGDDQILALDRQIENGEIGFVEHHLNTCGLEEDPVPTISVSVEDLIDHIVNDIAHGNHEEHHDFTLERVLNELRSYDDGVNDLGFDDKVSDYAGLMEAIVQVSVPVRVDEEGNEIDPGNSEQGYVTMRPSGSGFLLLSDLVMTNYHVISRPHDYQEPVGKPRQLVRILDSHGRSYDGVVVAFDVMRDLAIIEILGRKKVDQEEGLRIQGGGALSLGKEVFALGHPEGLDFSLSRGIISSFRRWEHGFNAGLRLIQTDAAVNPGNSGGPLVTIENNEIERVVGVASSIVTRSGGHQGLNLAIAYPEIRAFLNELGYSFEDGQVMRPVSVTP